jgi:hypothetical protein
VGEFFDENPEVRARLALFKEPEERIDVFLKDNIWDAWNNLTSLEKNKAVDALGEDFETYFLDSETRDYGAVDTSVKAAWLRMLHGDPPGTLSVTATPIKFPAPEIAQTAQAYYNYRRQNFPEDLMEVQSRYFDISSRSERRQWLQQHPYLPAYWDWRRDWLRRNPSVAPYIVEDEEKLSELLQWPTAKEAEEAYQQEPNLTLPEWQAMMGPALFNLVTDHVLLSEELQGPEKEALTKLAENMGMSVSELMSAIRRSYQGG